MHSGDSREDTISKRAALLGDRHRMGSLGASGPDDLSVFHHIRSRTMGHVKHRKRAISNWTTQKLPHLLTERELSVGQINKIFASEWISDHQVVVGTKCNSVSNRVNIKAGILERLSNFKQCLTLEFSQLFYGTPRVNTLVTFE